MKSKKKTQDCFSQKEIAESLSNAVVRALRPIALGEIPEKRLRDLREYAKALVEISFEHVEEGFLAKEELVAILTCSALYVQMDHVMGSVKIPMRKPAEELLGK